MSTSQVLKVNPEKPCRKDVCIGRGFRQISLSVFHVNSWLGHEQAKVSGAEDEFCLGQCEFIGWGGGFGNPSSDVLQAAECSSPVLRPWGSGVGVREHQAMVLGQTLGQLHVYWATEPEQLTLEG